MLQKSIEVLKMVMEDVENDVKRFEGLEFNGRNVAEYLGYHGAAIYAIAKQLKVVCEHLQKETTNDQQTESSI